jgi:hypothetical protein
MNDKLATRRGPRIRAMVLAALKHKMTRRLAFGAFLFLALYVLSYLVLVGRGERRARAARANDYSLVFSNYQSEKYESVVCAFYWPIYSLDIGYEDEKLRPTCMIPKSMSVRDYAHHCRCCLLDCIGLR